MNSNWLVTCILSLYFGFIGLNGTCWGMDPQEEKFTYTKLAELLEKTSFDHQTKMNSVSEIDRKNGVLYKIEFPTPFLVAPTDLCCVLDEFVIGLDLGKQDVEFFPYVLFDSEQNKKGFFWVHKWTFNCNKLISVGDGRHIDTIKFGYTTRVLKYYNSPKFKIDDSTNIYPLQ